ncbi:MAG: BLUF domain-containing protein [Pseudomonadota bacterium]
MRPPDQHVPQGKYFQLIYQSTIQGQLDSASIESLVNQSSVHNNRSDITGLLIQKNKRFLQILEGKPIAILRLFERIEQDHRHTDVHVLHQHYVDQRKFADWSMRLVAPDDALRVGGPVYNKLFESGRSGFTDHTGPSAAIFATLYEFVA